MAAVGADTARITDACGMPAVDITASEAQAATLGGPMGVHLRWLDELPLPNRRLPLRCQDTVVVFNLKPSLSLVGVILSR